MYRHPAKTFISLLLALSLSILLVACSNDDRLANIKERGTLVVVSRNSPTTYYLDKNGAAGFEYDLAQLFAEELGVELIMQPAFTLDALFTRLRRGEADIAAAGLSRSAHRDAQFLASVPYATLTPIIIYKTGHKRPRKLSDIEGRTLLVLRDSSHAETLRELQASDFPDIEWQELEEADSMELLERVASQESELALIDSSEFSVQQSLYPRVAKAFDLGAEEDMVWYMPAGDDSQSLQLAVNEFINKLRGDGRLERMREQHFGHASVLSRIGSHTFSRNMNSTLPRYEALIRAVADEYQLDWHLLAAVAYQESHWDPKATSPTGVRGMMMLTYPTAREMGVKDRLDARQSLRGGARYLKNIQRRLPSDIEEPDRTWMALAAYNIGLAHLEDARVLTERQGGDPHLWSEVMERLPLLQKREFYRTLRYGYARGQEAATYVQNIRHYYSILQWQASPVDQLTPPQNTDQHLPQALRHIQLKAL
ncbi:membrane-bound lytic murein transglycosylase MltF [Parahaliea sp. F7430]|uniref:Membrane-bound lytic murein transglycosylase F n=1 Tax=Sediminihaliea albiluteola TaxID=2758564 RepID=A0A7W2TVF1_9GAMM|nr:membrane-bound lytic murein transglycosylase MltF [Sediminihaliea albiluteola]MBA6412674.1 membrane-bound lytic murein transglycosylase MltF [Sediminihaliea albiluteola]